jgi:hypothetical protein
MEKENKTGDKVKEATNKVVRAVKGYGRGKAQGKDYIRKQRKF